jgi:putative acetyltransferase
MVAQGWQGRGVGTALFAALVDLADSWLNLSRLELGVFTDNAAGVALYKKFGFEVEAVERAEAFRAGSFADTYLMARLRPGLAVDVSAPPLLPEPAPEGTYALRAAEPEDLPGITALMNEPGVRYGTLRVPFMTEEEVRFLAEPPEGSKSILAVTGAEVLGLVVLVPFKGRRAHAGDLALLAVRDAQRGRGIGGALLGAALEVADDWLNLRRVSLTVQADNAAAVALYAARGFVVEGRRRADMFRGGGYADALVMARVRGV